MRTDAARRRARPLRQYNSRTEATPPVTGLDRNSNLPPGRCPKWLGPNHTPNSPQIPQSGKQFQFVQKPPRLESMQREYLVLSLLPPRSGATEVDRPVPGQTGLPQRATRPRPRRALAALAACLAEQVTWLPDSRSTPK